MFDLEGGRGNLGVAKEIHEELAVEIADADGFGHFFVDKLLHGRPGLLDGGIAGDDVLAIICEAGRIALRGVHVFEGNGKVDNVEVEVINAPVLELFFADWLDAIVVVEGVPEFGDEEEVRALDYAFFDGAGNTLAGFLFVAIVWRKIRMRMLLDCRRPYGEDNTGDLPHAPSKRR